MSGDVRNRMIEGAALLLARQGVQAASFGEVIKLTGAPRGSIYYHFPQGKEQMIEAAVALLGERAFLPIEGLAGAPAEVIASEVLTLWRSYIEGAVSQAGCAILAATVTGESPAVVASAARVFTRWRNRLSAMLEQGGLPAETAKGVAALLIAAIEGATVLSRADRSLDAYDLVAEQLLVHVEACAARS